MALAKMRSAQLVSSLGYDFIFQDVDVVWYKHPIQYFADDNGANAFDIYFQEDGARTLMFAPYDANSGFYFVRNNERTRHYLTSVLMSADFTLSTFNDQIVFGVVLSEHAVLHGLRVKILPRFDMQFPGGKNFHDRTNAGKSRMKRVLDGTSNSYIFHMSWTHSSVDKDLFFRQLGLWYLHDQCIGKSVDELLDGKKSGAVQSAKCCSEQPLYSCHYRDKPSLRPCPDSPLKDEDNVPWW
jgi:Nucleotide-diphospho-sugar transferase